eukprot:scaffold1846_cov65-Phaeocystis_antarctica.AAC.2
MKARPTSHNGPHVPACGPTSPTLSCASCSGAPAASSRHAAASHPSSEGAVPTASTTSERHSVMISCTEIVPLAHTPCCWRSPMAWARAARTSLTSPLSPPSPPSPPSVTSRRLGLISARPSSSAKATVVQLSRRSIARWGASCTNGGAGSYRTRGLALYTALTMPRKAESASGIASRRHDRSGPPAFLEGACCSHHCWPGMVTSWAESHERESRKTKKGRSVLSSGTTGHG